MKEEQIIYYFDDTSRVYGKDRGAPIYEKHFRPIKIVEENDKEYICDYGVINKRSNLLTLGRGSKVKYYTEQEKNDDVYINNNRYKISQKIMQEKNANILRKIDDIFNHNK